MLDIKEKSPSFCTQKILMEESFKPVIQSQQRLNLKVQDMVKNEIVKLLDSRLIYSISDSPWKILWKFSWMISRILPNSDHTQRSRKPTFTCPYGTFAYRRMPFGLCNAPATFQRCMTAIFHDMMEDYMEVLMDDFSVFENSFDCCLAYLDRMLVRCEETNFMLNWENCHFMVKEEIVLGHKIFRAGIEVDRAKINVIAKLPYPTNVKGLLIKDAKFDFFNNCKKAFNILKEKLTTAPIIISPDWNVPFELMCDASDFAVGVVLEKRIDAKFKLIYYASKTLNNAQEHYTTTEKELLAVVFSFDMFRSYLILSKTIVYIDYSTLKYLFSKQDAKPRLIRLGNIHRKGIADKFLDEHLMILKTKLNEDEPWYADYDEPYAFKLCRDNVMRRCVAGNKILEILRARNISSRSEMPQNNIQRDGAYENTQIYKERTKRWHDSRLREDNNLKVGEL
nr:reverse transcriptase domain-containing protein [Tanacetum cinerariifolium]